MTKSSNGNLLYRASRDGFTTKVFHDNCDYRENTVTIIKSNFNHVFGGFTSAKWDLNRLFIKDSNAFLFSLRRNGSLSNQKFKVTKPDFALRGAQFENRNYSLYGPTFGGGFDVYVRNSSNNYLKDQLDGYTPCYSNFGHSYELPPGYTYGSIDTKSYLAGAYINWFTTEIEVYQVFF